MSSEELTSKRTTFLCNGEFFRDPCSPLPTVAPAVWVQIKSVLKLGIVRKFYECGWSNTVKHVDCHSWQLFCALNKYLSTEKLLITHEYSAWFLSCYWTALSISWWLYWYEDFDDTVVKSYDERHLHFQPRQSFRPDPFCPWYKRQSIHDLLAHYTFEILDLGRASQASPTITSFEESCEQILMGNTYDRSLETNRDQTCSLK